MGSSYRYLCTSCDYSCCVSGGIDHGFYVTTETGICRQCGELVDYTRQILWPEPTVVASVTIGACPKCSKQVTEPWSDGDPCPKCGGRFGPRILELDWD